MKKNDKVKITHGNRAGCDAVVVQVFKTNNIKAKITTDGPFKNEVLELVRDGHYSKM